MNIIWIVILLLLGYIAYSLVTGKIYTQTWVSRRWVSYSRQTEPSRYWGAIATQCIGTFLMYLIFIQWGFR